MLATTLLATGVVPPPAAPGSARAALKERVSTSVARALTDAAATSLAGLRTRLAPGSPSIFAATLELGSKGPHPVPSLAAIQASVSAAVRAAVDAASAVPSWADADPESGTVASDGRVLALALALSGAVAASAAAGAGVAAARFASMQALWTRDGASDATTFAAGAVDVAAFGAALGEHAARARALDALASAPMPAGPISLDPEPLVDA